MTTKAFAYYRTSSATNVGEAKDSLPRQESAVRTYASDNDIEVVGEFYDAAVRGADTIDARPGFQAMLRAIAGNGVRTILVETANRFARDLIVQETGWQFLQKQGIKLTAVDSPNAFLDDTPTATLIRQILGAVAQFEKAALVARLAGARKRTGRTGGMPSLSVTKPDVVARARALRADAPTMSLRKIAKALEAEGYVTGSGKAYAAGQITRMVDAKPPSR
jgi:DNA invertase Pin-like site-specific DNA recombinase